MHPAIAELQRLRFPVRDDVIRRIARSLRDEVQPLLDELDRVKADAALEASEKQSRKRQKATA